MQPITLGDEYKLYLDTANNWSSPTWVELEFIEDLGLDPQPIIATMNPRGKKTPKHKRGRLDQMVTAKVLVTEDDTSFQAIEDAIWNDDNDGSEILHLALVRGDIATAGNAIWENDYVVTSSALDPSVDVGSSYDVEFKPAADSTNDLTRGTTS